MVYYLSSPNPSKRSFPAADRSSWEKLMRPAQILAVLDREYHSAREGHHTPVMLWGPPGVGKSQMVAQVAAGHKAPVIDIRLSQLEPTDLRGIPFRADPWARAVT